MNVQNVVTLGNDIDSLLDMLFDKEDSFIFSGDDSKEHILPIKLMNEYIGTKQWQKQNESILMNKN